MSTVNKMCIDWLLQSDQPSIRFAVKTMLFHETPKPEEIIALTEPASPVGQIMQQLQDNTYWIHARHFYSPKYVASHWSLLLLHEYHCPPAIDHLSNACEHVLTSSRNNWLDHLADKPIKDHEMACFFGNALRYTYAFGLGQHSAAQAMLAYLSQPKDGCDWCCVHNLNKPCLWGAIRVLWAFALVAEADRSPQIRASIQSALDLVLNSSEMLIADHPIAGIKQHALWEKTSFPLYYQSDRLFTLRVLQEHGQITNPAIQPALQWLQSKRKANGHWRASNPYRGRSWAYGLEAEEVERWVTLQALSILIAAGLESLE